MKRNIARLTGYSLVEILVVIAIVGMLSLITVPAFINYSQQGHLRAAVRQVHGDLRTMRLLAITNDLRIRIELQSDKMTYTYYSSADNGATWTAYTPKGKVSNTSKVEAPVTFSATTFQDIDGNGKPDIVFLPSGMVDSACSPSGGGMPTLTLSVPWMNITQNVMTITVSPAGNIHADGSHS